MQICLNCEQPFTPTCKKMAQIYCSAPACRIARYEAKKASMRRYVIALCNHCGRPFWVRHGRQEWCKHPLCQADKYEAKLISVSKNGFAKRARKRQEPKKPKPTKLKSQPTKWLCQYCDKPLTQKDFNAGFRITHRGECRRAWLKRDVDGYNVYPTSWSGRDMEVDL